MLEVALLGTGGMMPRPNRFLASCVCRLNGRLILIDCGEGTQVTHKMLGWGYKCIHVICFTHFHADHISGLPGMLLAIANSGRTEPLHLVGPTGLSEVVKHLCVIAPDLPYELLCTEVPYHRDGDETVLDIDGICIGMLPCYHRIPCFAYRLDIKRIGKFDLERAKALNIPMPMWSRLQKGETIVDGKDVYTPDMVLGDDRRPIRLSYCTDTRPVPKIARFIEESDLFICEGMYGDDESQPKAMLRCHMVFSEAAAIARDGRVAELWLTHFSPSLVTPEAYTSIARAVFPNTSVGHDRMTRIIRFLDE